MTSNLYRRSPNAIFSEVGSDVVALHVERGQCYGMEKVTAAVWSFLAEPTSIDAICDRLVTLYEVEPEVCQSDVERLIKLLRSEGLVEAASQGGVVRRLNRRESVTEDRIRVPKR